MFISYIILYNILYSNILYSNVLSCYSIEIELHR